MRSTNLRQLHRNSGDLHRGIRLDDVSRVVVPDQVQVAESVLSKRNLRAAERRLTRLGAGR